MGRKVRVREGIKIYLLSKFTSNMELLNEAINKFSNEAILPLKPFTSLVSFKGLKMNVAIALPSLLIPGELSFRKPDYVLQEDVWIDGKYLPRKNSVITYQAPELKREIPSYFRQNLSNKKKAECVLYQAFNEKSLEHYLNELLNIRHIAVLSKLAEKTVEGELRCYWCSHFLLSQLNIGKRLRMKILDLSKVRKLRYLVKPILYLEDKVVVGELTYNNSILFFGFNEDEIFKELLIRAVLYAC